MKRVNHISGMIPKRIVPIMFMAFIMAPNNSVMLNVLS